MSWCVGSVVSVNSWTFNIRGRIRECACFAYDRAHAFNKGRHNRIDGFRSWFPLPATPLIPFDRNLSLKSVNNWCQNLKLILTIRQRSSKTMPFKRKKCALRRCRAEKAFKLSGESNWRHGGWFSWVEKLSSSNKHEQTKEKPWDYLKISFFWEAV